VIGAGRSRRHASFCTRFGVAASLVLALLALAMPARAADRRTEAAAKDALRKAQQDYTRLDYDRAEARLQRAEHACGANRCTRGTKAALLRDLGTMQLLRGEPDAAAYSWAEALKVSPDVDLNPAYEKPDVRGEWEAARDKAGAGAVEQPAGDFVHTPAAGQAVNTPLPVYVEYPGSSPPATVVVKYRSASMNAYKRVELARVAGGWGGLIPCEAVTAGVMRYYIQGFDRSGEPILNSGDPKHPFSVSIRATLKGTPPSLPGQRPPSACGEKPECPPDNPDCNAPSPQEEVLESVPKLPDGEECTRDEQCSSGNCDHHKCTSDVRSRNRYPRSWFGVAASIDFLSLPAAGDTCKLNSSAQPANSAGYYCTDAYGFDFPTRASPNQNNALVQGNAGNVGGGFISGNVRVLLTFDYALTQNLLVGGRLGLVLDTYPGDAARKDGKGFFGPVHIEARGTYLFGTDPLQRVGFAPMVYAALGVAQFDADITVQVEQGGVPGNKPVQAWVIGGPFFVAAGGGVRYAFSPFSAFLASLKASACFGSNGLLPLLSPEIGMQLGF
jgi:hypothetical protein